MVNIIASIPFAKHDMRRELGGGVLGHAEAERAQINPGKHHFAARRRFHEKTRFVTYSTLALSHSSLISGSTSLAKFRSDSCQPR
jgi:hypothetical protein